MESISIKKEKKMCVFFSLIVTKCLAKIIRWQKKFVYQFQFEVFIYGLSVVVFFAFFHLFVFAIVLCYSSDLPRIADEKEYLDKSVIFTFAFLLIGSVSLK